jgi:2-amino-4-hydroxy-6-hydroxymethyldihydropteridine diphosphokinase
MTPQLVYLSLGSNIGDRLANLRAAIDALSPAGIHVNRISSVYETEPVDYLEQSWFHNCVVEAETNLEPLALLRSLQALESLLGSKKEFPKGPRLIDLDILFYGSETIATPELQVPHPRLHHRRFVLVPLAEIAPALTHPSLQSSAAELLARVADQSKVHRTKFSL